jgi:uracil-DNA glycosylase
MHSFSDLLTEPSWQQQLADELNKPYLQELQAYLAEAYKNKTIYPESSCIFSALNLTPFQSVNVVIVGQDPYHGGQAHGLAFSVLPGTTIPPSLKNIYKAIRQQVGDCKHHQGDLTGWAKQGVLLLNTVLTVEQKKPASHQNKGWETFTDSIIKKLGQRPEKIIFVLWGNYAKNKVSLIDDSKHTILTSVHPSPFSAHKGFFSNQHFSIIQSELLAQGKPAIIF